MPIRSFVRAPERALPLLREAIDLIAEIDPRSLRAVQRLLTGGFVISHHATSFGWYVQDDKACHISGEHLADAGVERVVLVILHETCHARLFRFGIGYEEPIRVRVEKICMRRELAFAKKLEASGRSEGWSDTILETIASLSPDNYTEKAFSNRYWLRQVAIIRRQREAEAPRWIRRISVERVLKRRPKR